MNQDSKIGSLFVTGLVWCSILTSVSAKAETLQYNREPLGNAVAGLSKKLGVTFVIKKGINTRSLVTLNLDDTNADTSRLLAASQLANSVDGDYQKVFVVSKEDSAEDIPAPQIDTNGSITFPSTSVPAQTALQDIANADFAAVRGSANLIGDVTFTSKVITVSQAASEFAAQTHTRWKAFYAIVPKGAAGNQFGSKIIGHTAEGRPIYQLPIAVWTSPKPAVVAAQPDASSIPADATDQNASTTDTQNSNSQQGDYPSYNQYPWGGGYSNYGGYNPYGGYGNGDGGYNMGYGSFGNGLTVLPSYNGNGGYPTYVFP